MGDAGAEPEAIVRSKAQRRVPIEFVRPNPRNPRTRFVRMPIRARWNGESATLSVDIKHRGDGGEVRLKYTSLEQLDRIIALLGA